MKKFLVFAITLYGCIFLAGCGLFNREFVSIEDYVYPTSNPEEESTSSYTASNEIDLKNALVSLVDSGETEGQIVISDSYSGNIQEDMDNAIWQVKSQDALCAYCVKNVSYEVVTVVTYNEIDVQISYSDIGIPLEDIHKLQYSTDLSDIIETSINNSDKKLVILVNKSSYSSTDMENLIQTTYESNPIICPVKPEASVNLFSGKNSQRLYEIEFDYKLDDQTLEEQKEQLNNITLFTEEEMNENEYDKTLTVIARMQSVEQGNGNTVYDALVLNSANSHGKALGFVALCREIGLEARIVYGQRDWEDCCWNIVKVDGNYYHVYVDTEEEQPLKTDEQMWGTFRWNTGDYPTCEVAYLVDEGQ